MIFKINDRTDKEESKCFVLTDIDTYEEITNKRTMDKVAQILTGVKNTFEYLDEKISPETKELIIRDMGNSYEEIYGIKKIYDDILEQLGFKLYLERIIEYEEIIDL